MRNFSASEMSTEATSALYENGLYHFRSLRIHYMLYVLYAYCGPANLCFHMFGCKQMAMGFYL